MKVGLISGVVMLLSLQIFASKQLADTESHLRASVGGGDKFWAYLTMDTNYYNMQAHVKDGWEFVPEYKFLAPNGWTNVNDEPDLKEEDYFTSEGNNVADVFTATMIGNIKKGGSGGKGGRKLPEWSLEGRAKGDYIIDPKEALIHVSESMSFVGMEGEEQVDSDWTLMTLSGENNTTYNLNDRFLTVGKNSLIPVGWGEFRVYGTKSGTEQKDTADLIIYDSSLTFEDPNKSICAKTDWEKIKEEENIKKITLTTMPEGYEDLLEIDVESVTPTNFDKGEVISNSATEWEYTALTEKDSDKWPGDDETRSWEVVLKTIVKESGKTYTDDKEIFVKSVFTYCKLEKASYPLALDYVKWKYIGLSGTYDAGLGEYGSTHPITRLVTYGPIAFTSENILASNIFHEHIHVPQSSTVFWKGGNDRTNYMTAYPFETPPNLPQGIIDYGYYWAVQELPAVNAEIEYAEVTGIDQHHESYWNRVQAYFVFYNYLMQNATNSELIE